MKRPKIPLLLVVGLLLLAPVTGEAADHATGDTLAYVVMLSDSEQAFTQDMVDTVKHHMDRVEEYYEGEAPDAANLDLETEYHDVAIEYTGNYGDYSADNRDTRFIEKGVQRLGYRSLQGIVTEKKNAGYDNVAILFVAPDTGRSYMRGGRTEYTTVFYFESKDTFSRLLDLDDTPSVVYAHELGHIFGADDEYQETGNTAYGELSWAPSEPMDRLYPSFNYETGPSVEESVMVDYGLWESLGWFDLSTPFSSWASGMIGWRDFDGDGTLDPFDNKIPVRFPERRAPILNASINVDTQVEYTNFDEVTATAAYDDTSLVSTLGFELRSPAGAVVDRATSVPTNFAPRSATVDADVPDDEKPGNWMMQFRYGDQLAAWYKIDVIAPLVRLTADSLDFGRVNMDATGRAALQITNDGKMPAEISDITVSSEENVRDTADRTVVDPQSALPYQVSLSPNDVGPITGSLKFDTNDPRHPSFSIPFSGFAYAIRHLQLSGPSRKKVDEPASFTVSYQESGTPADYSISVQRSGTTVTNRPFITVREEHGEATLSFGKYGDYTVSVDKSDSKEYEYRSDSAAISIERPVKELQLALTADQTQVKAGEAVTFTAKANGEPVSAELIVDGEPRGTGETFTIEFAEPGTHRITLQKDTERTDRVIRRYTEDSTTVQVEQQSILSSFLSWLGNLL